MSRRRGRVRDWMTVQDRHTTHDDQFDEDENISTYRNDIVDYSLSKCT